MPGQQQGPRDVDVRGGASLYHSSKLARVVSCWPLRTDDGLSRGRAPSVHDRLAVGPIAVDQVRRDVVAGETFEVRMPRRPTGAER